MERQTVMTYESGRNAAERGLCVITDPMKRAASARPVCATWPYPGKRAVSRACRVASPAPCGRLAARRESGPGSPSLRRPTETVLGWWPQSHSERVADPLHCQPCRPGPPRPSSKPQPTHTAAGITEAVNADSRPAMRSTSLAGTSLYGRLDRFDLQLRKRESAGVSGHTKKGCGVVIVQLRIDQMRVPPR